MHPRLIKNFMNILNSGDLNYLGIQVFLTTHNVITVNFTPKEHLFEIKNENGSHSIQNVSSHRNAFLSLTDELVPVYNHKLTKIIYVEDKDDIKFYNLIFNKLSKWQMLKESVEISLNFIPAEGKTKVIKIVKDFLENSKSGDLDDLIYGIVDKDKDENEEKCNIEVLNRYSFENYLFDPIYLFFYFKEKHAEKFQEIMFKTLQDDTNKDYEKKDVENLMQKSNYEIIKDQNDMQLIINLFISPIENAVNCDLQKIESSILQEYKSSIKQYETIKVKYPIKFIYKKGHDFEERTLRRIFGDIMPSKDDILKFLDEFDFFIVSTDLVLVFDNILFYKSCEFRLNVLEFLYQKAETEDMKSIIKACSQPLYAIQLLRSFSEKAKELVGKSGNTKDDKQNDLLIGDFDNFKNIGREFNVQATDKQFLIKDIVNLFEGILDKKQISDASFKFEDPDFQKHMLDLLKEYKENKKEEEKLSYRKNKLTAEIKKKIKKISKSFGKYFLKFLFSFFFNLTFTIEVIIVKPTDGKTGSAKKVSDGRF